MTFRRIAINTKDGITIELTGRKPFTVPKATVDTAADAAAVKTAIDTAAGQPVPIFVHKNRTGSYALATGYEPLIWPEDEPKDDPLNSG